MSLSQPERLVDRKSLAFELGRSLAYIAAMVKLGFPMPGGRCKVSDALIWLASHPKPLKKKPIVIVHNRHD